MSPGLLSPAVLALGLTRDLLALRHPVGEARAHLRAALDWLSRAQDAGGDGVSFAFGLKRGWHAPYPETTGYLIPTMWAAADRLGDPRLGQRAERMARWLLGLQLPGGAYPGGTAARAPEPEVFNTGMVLFGLLSAYERSGREDYLAAARRAGDWLVAVQDGSGSWSRHSHGKIPHAYHARVAWALLELGAATGDEAYRDAARRNLRWVAGLQESDGWLRLCAFTADAAPFTHTLAYAGRGLLESACLLRDGALAERAAALAGAALDRWRESGFLAGRYDRGWSTRDRFSCLTGCAQFACLWYRLFERDGDRGWLEGARGLTDSVKATQDLGSPHPGIRGGIKGSQPVWGAYLPYRYPNWAAKFFADALLLQERHRGA